MSLDHRQYALGHATHGRQHLVDPETPYTEAVSRQEPIATAVVRFLLSVPTTVESYYQVSTQAYKGNDARTNGRTRFAAKQTIIVRGDMIMRKITPAYAFLAAAGSAAAQPPNDLFGSLKTFCFDTGARRDAIQVAITSAGGSVDSDTSLGIIWRYDPSPGQQFLIGSMDLPGEHGPRNNCLVELWGHDDASMNAIRKWIGVPAVKNDEDADKSEVYFFQIVGSAHMAIVGAAAAEAAIAERRCWSVSLERDSTSDKVYLFDCGNLGDIRGGHPTGQ
jgi:hypothetical protein